MSEQTEKTERTSSAVLGAAFLEASWATQGHDYLDAFAGFVAIAIYELPNGAATDEIRERIKSQYGLDLPLSVIRTVIKRANNQALLTKVDEEYFPNVLRLREKGLIDRKAEIERDIQLVISSIVAYARDELQFPLNFRQAELGLEAVASTTPEMSARRYVNTPLEGLSEVEFREFVVADYLLQKEDPIALRLTESLSRGAMIGSSIFYTDPCSVSAKIDKLTLYIDTNVCLRILGYEGSQLEAEGKDFVRLAQELGCTVRLFTHTKDEVDEILQAVESAIRSGERRQYSGHSFRHFLSGGFSAAQVAICRTHLSRDLSSLNISEVPTPKQVRDEQEQADLRRAISAQISYTRTEALTRDVQSLLSVNHYRNGAEQHRFEDSRAIFVTSNSSLRGVAEEFFAVGHASNRRPIPIAMSERLVTTLLWVKKPLSFPDRPRLQVLADCASAVIPPEAFWRTFDNEVSQLRSSGDLTDDDVMLLRFGKAVSREVFLTSYRGSSVSQETVRLVLERVTHGLRREGAAAVEGELQLAQVQLEGVHSALGTERQAKSQAEIERDALARELGDQRALARAEILTRAGRRGSLARGLVLATGISTFLALLVFSWPGLVSGAIPWVARVAVAVALVIQFVGAIDWSLRDLASKAEAWAEDTVAGRRELR